MSLISSVSRTPLYSSFRHFNTYSWLLSSVSVHLIANLCSAIVSCLRFLPRPSFLMLKQPGRLARTFPHLAIDILPIYTFLNSRARLLAAPANFLAERVSPRTAVATDSERIHQLVIRRIRFYQSCQVRRGYGKEVEEV